MTEIRRDLKTLPLESLALEEQFPAEYQALKGLGMSAFYALRVLTDFKRGDSTAVRLVTIAKENQK